MKYLDYLPSMDDVYTSEKKELFTVISTFAGCGGSSMGYRLAGGKILCINEFIQSAIDTYKANYPSTPILTEDIRKLSGDDFLKVAGIKKGELDILDGSPPCASFSMAGKREESWGKEKKYSETTQRVDDLFFEFARILKEIQPKVFVTENVKGLTVGAAKDVLGSEQMDLFGDYKKTIFHTLIDCGYRVSFKVISAADFHVPQGRERLFIIGVRKDLNKEPVFPIPLGDKTFTVRECWEDLPLLKSIDKESKLPSDSWIMKYLPLMKPGESISDYHEKGAGFTQIRLNMDTVSPTILQSTKYFHPIENRYVNITELRRIHSFPDDFIVTGSFSKQWERIGRSVPPLLMKAVVEHIYKNILKGETDEKENNSEESKD